MVQQPTATFEERLSKEELTIKEAADKMLSEGHAREVLLLQVQQDDTASNIENWLRSKICAKAC